MSKNKLKIESRQQLCGLMNSLVSSGYDLHVTPVYGVPEAEKNRAERLNYTPRPSLRHYSVEIGDKHANVVNTDDCEF